MGAIRLIGGGTSIWTEKVDRGAGPGRTPPRIACIAGWEIWKGGWSLVGGGIYAVEELGYDSG